MNDIEWTADRIRFAWIAAAVIALFFTIGVISSMRWVSRKWSDSQKNRAVRKAYARYAAMAQVNRPLPFVPPAAPVPMRTDDGPRDWTPKQYL